MVGGSQSIYDMDRMDVVGSWREFESEYDVTISGFDTDVWDLPGDYYSDQNADNGGSIYEEYDLSRWLLTGLGEGVDELVNFVPEFERNLARLLADGWRINFAQLGDRTNGERDINTKTLTLDIDMQGDRFQIARTLAHEVSHVINRAIFSSATPTQAEYVSTWLQNEGQAMLWAMDVNTALSVKYPEARSYNWGQYGEIYSQIGTNYTAASAMIAMGQLYANELRSDGLTVRAYYEQVWANEVNQGGGSTNPGGTGGSGGSGGSGGTGGTNPGGGTGGGPRPGGGPGPIQVEP